jgi:hypothetical protein
MRTDAGVAAPDIRPRRRSLVGLLALACAVPGVATPQSDGADPRSGQVPPPRRWPQHDPYPWESPQIDGVDVLFVDDAPLILADAVPATGPLARFASRPGAWYTAVFVALWPGAPAQLWLWQRAGTHAVRLIVLDAPPRLGPSVAAALPVRAQRGGRAGAHFSAPFALPARSAADGAFVLIEQWSVAGDRPGPLWVQARSRLVHGAERTPWWSARPDPDGPLAPEAPPGPLQSARTGGDVIEVPIMQRAGAPLPRLDPWGPR